MSQSQFDYTCLIAAPPSHIYEFLSEPQNYRGLQPLVIDVRDVEYGEDEEGHQIRRYVAVERFRFLSAIRYDNPIRVLVTLAKPGELLINDVEARFNVRVHFVTAFKPDGIGTEVAETVTIHAPRLLQSYTVNQAKAAQQARFSNLKTLLEAAHTRA
jgi:hypothetical protein